MSFCVHVVVVRKCASACISPVSSGFARKRGSCPSFGTRTLGLPLSLDHISVTFSCSVLERCLIEAPLLIKAFMMKDGSTAWAALHFGVFGIDYLCDIYICIRRCCLFLTWWRLSPGADEWSSMVRLSNKTERFQSWNRYSKTSGVLTKAFAWGSTGMRKPPAGKVSLLRTSCVLFTM